MATQFPSGINSLSDSDSVIQKRMALTQYNTNPSIIRSDLLTVELLNAETLKRVKTLKRWFLTGALQWGRSIQAGSSLSPRPGPTSSPFTNGVLQRLLKC